MAYGLPANGELNWDVKLNASIEAVKATADAAVPATEKGAANGVATLGADGKVPAAQLAVEGTASSTTFAPAGNIAATDVQTAIQELDAEKSATSHTHSLVGARATSGSTQSVSDNTVTTIALDVETFDTSGFHDTVTNNTRITIPAGLGGTYLVEAGAGISANATGTRQCRIHVNGTLRAVTSANAVTAAGLPTRLAVSDVFQLVSGDYVELAVYHSAGTSLSAEADLCRLAVVRLGS